MDFTNKQHTTGSHMVGTAHHFVRVKNWALKRFVNTAQFNSSIPRYTRHNGIHYLQDFISKETWTLLAHDRLMNPFLIAFLKMTNLHPQKKEHNQKNITLAEKQANQF
jgi:hypothetical protein